MTTTDDITPDIKLIEIRDRMTTIAAMAIQVSQINGWLMRRAGFGAVPMVYLINLATEESHYDPFNWPTSRRRTMGHAHRYLADHWDEVANGSVVDVEFILGETVAPKTSDREKDSTL